MTISVENFIKTVYQLLQEEQEAVTPSKLASELKVSNAAITDMAKKLEKTALINYRKYGDISLTRSGELLALKVIRKHRLWELFLYKVLNLSARDIHFEAELLEHQTTDFLINRIDEYLGNPKYDPHGDPIPDKDYLLPESEGVCALNLCPAGKTYLIKRLIHRSGELSTFYRDHEITLDEEIRLDQIMSENQVLICSYKGKHLVMGVQFSKYIHVKEKS